MEKPPYTTRFEIIAQVILPTEQGKMQEIKASISSLKQIFPQGMDPKDDKDLLYIAGNLAVANLVNKNGDCITGETTLQVYKKFEKKFIDLDHDRSKIHGYIMVAGLSDFSTSELITDEEAAKINGPFNIAIGGIIWRAVNDKLVEYLVKASDEDSDQFGTLSFSFEVGFWDYKIAVGSNDVTKATVYNKEDHPDEFAKYSKYLKANKGKGQDKDGNLVYRVIDTKVIPLGAGIVVNPAAEVEGITTLVEIAADEEINEETEISEELMAKLQDIVTQIVKDTIAEQQRPGGVLFKPDRTKELQAVIGANGPEPKSFVEGGKIEESTIKETDIHIDVNLNSEETNKKLEEINEILASSTQLLEESLKNNSQNKNSSVNPNIPIMPKITKAEDIVSSWADLVKNEAAASEITKFIADEIARKSEEHVKELQAKETAAAELKKNTDAALAEVATLRSELDVIKAEKAAREAQAKFDERMNGFDNEYDLTDEDRQVIASSIKSLDDAAFTTYSNNFKVLAKEKSKTVKLAKASAITQELEKKGVKATIDKDLNFSEIVAKAVETEKPTIPTGSEPNNTDTIAQKMAKAFGGDAITVNGKPLKRKE